MNITCPLAFARVLCTLLIKYKIPCHGHGPVIVMFIFKVKYVERYVNYDITIYARVEITWSVEQ